MSDSESESKVSWVFLGAAILAVAWGIWLKLNEPEEPENKIEWVRREGKLVEKDSGKLYQGVRQLAFDGAPDTVEWEYTYIDGMRNGPAIEYFPGLLKTVKSRATYVDGAVQGPVLNYHSNGELLSKATAVDGLLNGLVTFYDVDGTVDKREVYERSAPAGVAAVTVVPDLVPEEEEAADQDVPEVDILDPPLMLDEDGNPYTGTQVGTFFGGAKALEHGYKEGREHGMHQGWAPEGEPEYERPYVEGKKHGIWKHWAEGGRLVSESSFHHGLQTGSAKSWFPDNQPRQQSQFVHGAEHGVRTNIDRGGRLRRETTFDYGIQIHQKEWSPKGEVTKDVATPAPAGIALVIEPSEDVSKKSVPVTDLPEDLDGGTLIGFRYRVSTDETEPVAGSARPFKASVLLDGAVIGLYEFTGELGGWNFHQWLANLSDGGSLTIDFEASPGSQRVHVEGIGYIDDPEDESQ